MTPRPDAIGLIAQDLSASLAFYRRLGLDIPEGLDDAPHVEHSLSGGLRLMWDPVSTVRSMHPDWTPPTGTPRISLTFLCGDPAEVDEYFSDVVAAGAEATMQPFDAPWGQRYASVLDPDGNGVDLFAPLT